MNRDLAQQYLEARVNRPLLPNLYHSFNGSIGLRVGSEAIGFRVRHSELTWLPQQLELTEHGAHGVEATFRFNSWADMADLLCGTANLMDAFMQGRVRADGYLLWTFTLLALFRGEAPATLPVPPS